MSEELKNMIVTKAAELAIIGAVLWAAKAHKKYTRALRWRKEDEESAREDEIGVLQGKMMDLELKLQQAQWGRMAEARVNPHDGWVQWVKDADAAREMVQKMAQKLKDAPPYPDLGGAVEEV